jgi:hypothetical protein
MSFLATSLINHGKENKQQHNTSSMKVQETHTIIEDSHCYGFVFELTLFLFVGYYYPTLEIVGVSNEFIRQWAILIL